ncbi:MAG: hypothetical protein AAGE94_07685 [Acidobacteriota bacterium]
MTRSVAPRIQRDNYRARDRDSPPYGWLQGLAAILNETAGVGSWCYSGSFALFCWAWVKDGDARDPGDVDILVADDKFHQVVAALAERGKQGRTHTGYTPVDLTLKVVGLDQSETRFPVKIDVQLSGSKYGDVGDLVQLDKTNNFPVLSIEALIGRKMKASELVRMQREFVDEKEAPPLSKDEKDLTLLEALRNKDGDKTEDKE